MTADQLVKEGIGLYCSGSRRAALKKYERAVDIDPKFIQAWGLAAEVHLDLGDASKALECCDRAIALDKNIANYHFVRAKAADALGRREDAIASYTSYLVLATDGQDYRDTDKLARKRLMALGAEPPRVPRRKPPVERTEEDSYKFNKSAFWLFFIVFVGFIAAYVVTTVLHVPLTYTGFLLALMIFAGSGTIGLLGALVKHWLGEKGPYVWFWVVATAGLVLAVAVLVLAFESALGKR